MPVTKTAGTETRTNDRRDVRDRRPSIPIPNHLITEVKTADEFCDRMDTIARHYGVRDSLGCGVGNDIRNGGTVEWYARTWLANGLITLADVRETDRMFLRHAMNGAIRGTAHYLAELDARLAERERSSGRRDERLARAS